MIHFLKFPRFPSKAPKQGSQARLVGGFNIFTNVDPLVNQGAWALASLVPGSKPQLRRVCCFPLPTVAAFKGHWCAAGGMMGLAFDFRVMASGSGSLAKLQVFFEVFASFAVGFFQNKWGWLASPKSSGRKCLKCPKCSGCETPVVFFPLIYIHLPQCPNGSWSISVKTR